MRAYFRTVPKTASKNRQYGLSPIRTAFRMAADSRYHNQHGTALPDFSARPRCPPQPREKPMEVLCLGLSRTGTMCEHSPLASEELPRANAVRRPRWHCRCSVLSPTTARRWDGISRTTTSFPDGGRRLRQSSSVGRAESWSLRRTLMSCCGDIKYGTVDPNARLCLLCLMRTAGRHRHALRLLRR